MSISHEYHVTGIKRDETQCKHCGAKLVIALVVSGSAGVPDRVDHRDEMDQLVAPALSSDFRRTRGLVRCPSCKQRAPGAVAMSVARVAIWLAGVPILPIIAPGPLDILWVIPVLFVAAATGAGLAERRRWRRASAAQVNVLELPKQPRAQLPAARALGVPATPKAAPLASVAPPVQAPRDPASLAEPSLLTSRDRE